MDFVVDKKAQTVSITEVFDADRDLVWDAYTKAEILDQWWAPKPLTSDTMAMDFEVGGRRFYAMVMPDGQRRYAVQRYTSITPKSNFKFFNAFSDENENVQLPGSDWDFNFSDEDGKTKVDISIYNESLERMEMIIADGNFLKGAEGQIENLKELLTKMSRAAGAK
ncbi:MAG: SRPBCC domain-containing protein [Acidobacteria bacterium]|nr:SRPBCC domain-containing protein [Acidobacteriota bacterium]